MKITKLPYVHTRHDSPFWDTCHHAGHDFRFYDVGPTASLDGKVRGDLSDFDTQAMALQRSVLPHDVSDELDTFADTSDELPPAEARWRMRDKLHQLSNSMADDADMPEAELGLSACAMHIGNHSNIIHAHAVRAKAYGVESSLTVAEWTEIYDSHNGECVYCGVVASTVDHIVPLSKGGGNTRDNVVPACRRCNTRKRCREVWSWVKSSGKDRATIERRLGAALLKRSQRDAA